jgi:DNA (cytosine-5)-methyltransferase 1
LETDDDDDDDEVYDTDDEPSALCRSITRHPTQDDEIIEVPDDDRSSEESDLQFLQSHGASGTNKAAPTRRKSSVKHYPPRNPPIVDPFEELERFQYGDLLLRKGKSVELQDGDFLRIKVIVGISGDDQVMIRGHRLQRCSSMNGMLERKLNELCVFHEVDLDDPRDILEQSVVEVPVKDIKKLRNIRWTNHRFPKDRNFTISDFQNQQDVAADGGLTVRWKYTCKYASVAHRHHNNYMDRMLEHISKDDLPVPTNLSDEDRRFEWRGETAPGGAYQPQISSEDNILASVLRGESPISLCETPDPDPLTTIIRSRSSSVVEVSAPKKRKYEGFQISDLASNFATYQKRPRHEEDDIKETTKGVKQISLEHRNVEVRRVSFQVNLESGSPTAVTNPIPSLIERTMSSGQFPQYGSIRCPSPSESTPRTRSPGQMLTYGDAFCGAGGTTRGAFMAGLRVRWGFDFSKHACETWRANFPNARCYPMTAHQFVQLAQRAARKGFPEVMKVDILHLSPPCQYFSDAHTVNGKDDEINTASLFAVRDVIEVAKPRVVTLEQTFGITRAKFMWYLSALIQMFTSLDFSVRWAVVRLAQWVRSSS